MALTELSFRSRVLLGMALVIALLGVTLLAGVELVVRKDVLRRLDEDLTRSVAAVTDELNANADRLASEVRVVGEEPRIKAVLNTNEVNNETLRDVAEETRPAVGFGMLGLVTGDAEFQGFANTKGDAHAPLVQKALGGVEAKGFWVNDGVLYQAVATPVTLDRRPIGAVIAGNQVDSAFAETLARRTRVDVAFFADGKQHASSLPPQQASELSEPRAGDLKLQGESFLARDAVLEGVHVVVLASEEDVLRPYRRLERAVLGVCLAALLFAAGLTFFIAGGLAKPVAVLIDFARKVGKGDLEARVPKLVGSELSALADTLNHMADELSQQKRRDELAGFLVHDLKNPLTSVVANAQLQLSDPKITGMTREIAQETLTASETMLAMLMDLLDVGKNADGKLTPSKSEFLVSDLFEMVRLSSAGRAAQKKQNLVIASQPPKRLSADRELLRRVIDNLLDNCFKYTPRGGNITLEWRSVEPGFVDLRVADEGPGIPKEARERIFDRYFRLDRDASAHARTSRGLGLVFCKAAAEAHGGKIWAEDNVPKGSAFVVRLPDSAAQPSTASPLASA